jgi:hypothetical protein
MLKSQLLSIISKIRMGATSPTNISDSLEALATNPPYGGTAITTTLPTVLAQREQVIYRDPNGVQSLWIGNADGEAWPAVGHKEMLIQVNGFYETATSIIIKDDVGISGSSFVGSYWDFYVNQNLSENTIVMLNAGSVYSDGNDTSNLVALGQAEYLDDNGGGGPRINIAADATIDPFAQIVLTIRIYP